MTLVYDNTYPQDAQPEYAANLPFEEGLQKPEIVGQNAITGRLPSFLKVVAATFPSPEIVEVNLSDVGEEKLIKIKVKVSGSFVENSWYWEEFLKYYKLSVFLAPNTDDMNSFLKQTSLFDYKSFPITNVVFFPAPSKEENIRISDMEGKSVNIKDEYYFVSQIKIPLEFLTGEFEHHIVARTFFDVELISKDFLEDGVLPFSELDDLNNGLWDAIVLENNDNLDSYVLNRVQAYYSYLEAADEEIKQLKWNGAFRFDEGEGRYYISDPTDLPEVSSSLFEMLFEKSPFYKADPSHMIDLFIENTIETEKNTRIELDYSGKRKRMVNIPVTSDVSYANFENKDVDLFFSVDFLELFKQTSDLPDNFFDNLKQNLLGNTIKNFKITDDKLKEIDFGVFEYKLEIEVESQIKQRLQILLEGLTVAQKILEDARFKFSNPDNYDPETKELLPFYLESGGEGAQVLIDQALNLIYSSLEVNLLQEFFASKMVIKRYQLDQKKEFTREETVYDLNSEIGMFSLDGELNMLELFSFDDISYLSQLLYTRQEFVGFYNLSDMTVDKLQSLIDKVEKLKESYKQLTGTVNPETNAISDKAGSRVNGRYQSSTYKTTFVSKYFREIMEDKPFDPNLEELFLNEDDNLVVDFSISTPGLECISFRPAITTDSKPDALSQRKTISQLDLDEEKYIFEQNKEDKMDYASLEDALRGQTSESRQLSLQYLSGYGSAEGVDNLMREPIYLEYDPEALESGRTYLFKIKKDKEFPIYSEYFTRKA